MRLAVGYPLLADEDGPLFVETVRRYRREIEEVYFAWPGDPSGRAPAGGSFGAPGSK